jgi:hypothetical protein
MNAETGGTRANKSQLVGLFYGLSSFTFTLLLNVCRYSFPSVGRMTSFCPWGVGGISLPSHHNNFNCVTLLQILKIILFLSTSVLYHLRTHICHDQLKLIHQNKAKTRKINGRRLQLKYNGRIIL